MGVSPTQPTTSSARQATKSTPGYAYERSGCSHSRRNDVGNVAIESGTGKPLSACVVAMYSKRMSTARSRNGESSADITRMRSCTQGRYGCDASDLPARPRSCIAAATRTSVTGPYDDAVLTSRCDEPGRRSSSVGHARPKRGDARLKRGAGRGSCEAGREAQRGAEARTDARTDARLDAVDAVVIVREQRRRRHARESCRRHSPENFFSALATAHTGQSCENR